MDIATNGLYGIAPANSVPIEMFERVEVMRGLNGGGGGTHLTLPTKRT